MTLGENPNYAVTAEDATFTITAAPADELGLKATGYTGVYDANSHAVTAEVTVTDGTTIEYSTDDGETWSETAPAITNVGTVEVLVRATNPDYETATETVTLTVTRKAVTVEGNDRSKAYGAMDPVLSAEVSGTLNGDTVEYTVRRENGETPGNYVIRVTGAAEQGNYAVTYINATFTIYGQYIPPVVPPVTPPVKPTPAPTPTTTPAPTPTETPTPIQPEQEVIPEEKVPQAGPAENASASAPAMALLNLLCSLGSLGIGIVSVIDYFKKKKSITDPAMLKNVKNKLFNTIPAVGSVAAFLLTEKFSSNIVMTDKWTVLMAALLAASGGLAYWANKTLKPKA